MSSIQSGIPASQFAAPTSVSQPSGLTGSQAQHNHPVTLPPAQLSSNAHQALNQLTNVDHQRVASQVRNALEDGTFRLQSNSRTEATYQAFINLPRGANPMSIATIHTRLNDQSLYDIVSAHLHGPSISVSVNLSGPPPASTHGQASSVLSGRARLGINRSLLRYAVPPIETEDQCVLVIDKMPPPKNGEMSFFRATSNLSKLPSGIEKGGLSSLKLAGCERISSVEQVENIRAALGNGPLTVLDLREESHAIVNGLPVTLRGPMDWANAGLPKAEGSARESAMITKLKRTESVTLVDANYVKGKKSEPQTTELRNLYVQSEQEVVTAGNATYRRVAITDHNRPSPEATDELVDIMRHCLQENEAIVVHCNGGRGRTTTAMTMVDMLKNARNYSAQTIIERMAKLSYDYNMTDLDRVSAIKRPFLQDRLKFLHAFHDYAYNNPGGLPLNWTEWRKKLAAE